jgi:hypothetical protein
VSSVSDFFDGWNPTVEIREPFWLTRDERTLINDAIVHLVETTAVFPATRQHLDAVLTELGVAEARDHVAPTRSQIMRQAHGYTPDTIPIRMSAAESTAIASLPTLPTSIRARLSNSPANP